MIIYEVKFYMNNFYAQSRDETRETFVLASFILSKTSMGLMVLGILFNAAFHQLS